MTVWALPALWLLLHSPHLSMRGCNKPWLSIPGIVAIVSLMALALGCCCNVHVGWLVFSVLASHQVWAGLGCQATLV